MTDRQALLDRVRDLEAAVFSLETKLAVRGYEEQMDVLQNALFQAQNAAIGLAHKVKMYETALEGDGSVVKPLYTSTQPQIQPCAGRNCGSTNPNLHSAECFEDYEKATGMNQWQGLTDEEIQDLSHLSQKIDQSNATWFDRLGFARAVEQALKEKNHG